MRRLAMVVVPALVAAACGGALAEDGAGGGTLYVRSEMQGPVNEATNALWDIGNNAMGDDGAMDPALMDEGKWAALAGAADRLETASNRMAEAGAIRAAIPGHEADVEPGAYSMEDVQSYIDADPAAFRLMAKALAQHAAKIGAAAKARDAEQAGSLVGELDQVCETCHAKYWYPEG